MPYERFSAVEKGEFLCIIGPVWLRQSTLIFPAWIRYFRLVARSLELQIFRRRPSGDSALRVWDSSSRLIYYAVLAVTAHLLGLFRKRARRKALRSVQPAEVPRAQISELFPAVRCSALPLSCMVNDPAVIFMSQPAGFATEMVLNTFKSMQGAARRSY